MNMKKKKEEVVTVYKNNPYLIHWRQVGKNIGEVSKLCHELGLPSFDDSGPKLTKVEIVCREYRLENLKQAMMDIGITGMTVSHVLGCGVQKGKPEFYRGIPVETTLLPKVQVEIVVSKVPVRSVIETAKKVLYTGHIGDGKIFVYDVENVVKVRTGEEGYDALQDEE